VSIVRCSLVVALVLLPMLPSPAAAGGAEGCPAGAELEAQWTEIAPTLEAASRSSRFGHESPVTLYRKAARSVGRPRADRDGDVALGVMFAELPIEDLWRAVNDESHHALEGYLPLEHSEVLEGKPRGSSRIVFQWFGRFGVARWWVSRVRMNGELYEASGGRLWEIYWEDQLGADHVRHSPVAEIAAHMPALDSTEGAWLFSRFGSRCTAVEYFARAEPGGVVEMAQILFATKAVRDSLEGLARMASEHLDSHPALDFRRPDGTLLPPR
jgi:hypothetical protein